MDVILIACSLLAPSDCRSERFALSSLPLPAESCMHAAIPALVEWLDAHPGLAVARWTCTRRIAS